MEDKSQSTNSFLVILLSSLLIISCLIAGFFAWKTQQLVKQLQVTGNKPTPMATSLPSPTSTPSPVTFDNLKNGDTITSPVKLIGAIDRSWTFEATFSIEIIDSAGKSLQTIPVGATFENEQSQIGTFIVTVPFVTKAKSGFVVVHADNPSGLPQNDKSIKIPVLFFNKNSISACTMEAKLCPDGSSVERSGPNCEFAACPSTSPKL